MLIVKKLYTIIGLLLISLCLVPMPQAQAQAWQYILHRLWDREAHCLMFIPWAGPPDGAIVHTIETMLSDIVNPVTHAPCVITNYQNSGDTLPLTCIADKDIFFNTMSKTIYTCNSTGTGWNIVEAYSEAGVPAENTVGSAEVINNALTGTDINESTLVLTGLIGAAELTATTVTPGVYGTAATVPIVTVDADGRVTAAATTPIIVGSTNVTDNTLTGTDINESTLVLTELVGSTDVVDNALSGTDINESTLVLTGLIGSTEVVDNSLTGTDINESTLVMTGLIGPGELVSTAVTPGAYGAAGSVATLTVDADGRLTAAATVPIVVGSTNVTDNTLTGNDIDESTLALTGLVGSAEVVDNALTGTDINESTLVLVGLIGAPEVADNTLTGTDIADNTLTGTDINESTLVLTGLVGAAELTATTVTPGAYGSASSVGTFTTDADGRLTAAATVPIAITFDNHADVDLVTFPPLHGAVLTYDEATAKSAFRLPEGGGGIVTGIDSDVSGVNSIHYNSVTLTNICGLLGSVSYINVIAGPSGVTCILPDPSLLATPSRYFIVVEDNNNVTLAPGGTNLLNGFNSPLPAIKGPRGLYTVERLTDTAWLAQSWSSVGLGEPMTSHSYMVNETKTNSTTSDQAFTTAYTIPANFLKEGTSLCFTLANQYVTDASPSTIKLSFKLGAAAAYAPPAVFTPAANTVAVLASEWCIYGTADPGPEVGVTVAPMMQTSSLADINVVWQYVTLATNGDIAINPFILYSTNTGGESFAILHVTIKEFH